MIPHFSDIACHPRTGREFFVVCPLWVPYVRIGQERWTKRAKRYLQSRDALAKFVMFEANRQQITADAFRHFSVSVDVFIQARKSRRKGEAKGVELGVGSTRGDLDNYLKAALDSAQVAGVIGNDSPDRWLMIDRSSVFTISPERTETGVIRFSEVSNESAVVAVGDSILDVFEARRRALDSGARPNGGKAALTSATARVTREG